MSKYQFKKLIKQKVEKLAIENLEARKKQKSIKLNIKTFKPQDYIISKKLSINGSWPNQAGVVRPN